MPDYILRNIDPTLWRKFKERAAKEGRPLRWILIVFIRKYITRGLDDES